MVCTTCGSEAPNEARFCPTCGHELHPLSDERRVVTVLFADLVGFTSMSETRDPEQVKNLVDRCFQRLAQDITEFGGRVDKIIGDAIVALFGAPVAHEDDAERAVRAGLRMQETLNGFISGIEGAELRMRIGVNTGEVLVGAMSAGGDYTAMGDVVNTASRLQTSAQPGEVLVGPATHAATRQVIAFEARGLLEAKGRDARVEAWVATEAIMPPGYRPKRTTSPLVGRDTELGMLSRAIDTAIGHSRAGFVLLVGDAGVGKTRLALEVGKAALSMHGAVVLEGRCVPYGEANVWWPVAEAVRDACLVEPRSPMEEAQRRTRERVGQAIGDGVLAAEMDRITKGLMHLMGYEGQLRGVDPSSARDEATRSLVAFIEGSSRFQPVVIKLSDLHWADTVVLELIDTLLDRLSRRPFVIVATSRESLLDQWTPAAGRYNNICLHIDPLPRDASAELLTSLLGHAPSAELRDVLLERSGGNPFYLEELVALMGPSSHDAAEGLPDTLRGLVAARLDSLTPEERTVLQDAAVLGPRGAVGHLRLMTKSMRQPVDIDAVVSGLVAKDVFQLDDGDWSFRSELVREVAYGTLTKVDRALRHVGIASWIEDHLGDDLTDDLVDRLANHYGVAAELSADLGGVDHLPDDLRERALRWVGEAARRAEQNEVLPVASRLYAQALELAGPAPSAQRLQLLLGRSHVLSEAWDLGPARVYAEAVLEEAPAVGDLHAEAKALSVIGDVEQKEGNPDGAIRTLSEAAARFEALGDRMGQAEALRLRGMAELFKGSLAEAKDSVGAALAAFEEVDDRRGQAWALQNLAWIAFLTGQTDEADSRLQQSVATFSDIGDTAGLAWAMGLLAWVRFQQGRSAEAEALARPILSEARARGDRWASGMMSVLLASLELWSGHTHEAIDLAGEARGLFAEIGDHFGLVQAVGPLSRALIMAGRVDEGMRVFAECTDEMPDGASPDTIAAGVTIGLAMAVQVGDIDRIRHLRGRAEPSLAPGAFGDDDRRIAHGLADLQEGDPAAALAALSRVGGGEFRPEDLPSAGAALALALAANGRADEAVSMAEAAADSMSPRTTYLDRFLGRITLALVAATRGQTELARAEIDEACGLVDSTGDRLSQGIVRLAKAHVLRYLNDPAMSTAAELANSRLEAMGISAAGWATAFDLVLAAAPVQPA